MPSSDKSSAGDGSSGRSSGSSIRTGKARSGKRKSSSGKRFSLTARDAFCFFAGPALLATIVLCAFADFGHAARRHDGEGLLPTDRPPPLPVAESPEANEAAVAVGVPLPYGAAVRQQGDGM